MIGNIWHCELIVGHTEPYEMDAILQYQIE